MGLDQYVQRRIQNGTALVDDITTITTADGVSIPADLLGGVAHSVSEDCVAYFRKNNAVHGWIINNLANGVDECQRIYLTPESVNALLAALDEALADPQGNDVMPPTTGFFFGSQDRDQYYVEDLADARKAFGFIHDLMLKDVERRRRAHEDGQPWSYIDYYYQASW